MPDVGDRETQGLRTLGNQTRKNWNRWGVINTDRGAGTGGTGTWGRSGGVGTGGMGHGGAGSGGRSGGAGRSRRFRGAGTGVCSGLGRATDGCWLGWVMSAWAPIANKTNMWCRFTYRLQFWIMTGILYSCHRSIFEYQTMCKSSVEVGLVYKTFANKHTRQWSPVQCCVMKRVDGRGGALLLSLRSMCARERSSGRHGHIWSSTLVYIMKKPLRNLYEPGSTIFGTEILGYTSKLFIHHL